MPRRRLRVAMAALAGLLALAACGSSASSSPPGGNASAGPKTAGSTSTTLGAYGTLPAESGAKVTGGTITYPIIAGSQPTWILPIETGAQFTVYNAAFEIPMFRPLYWVDIGNRPVVNPALSVADPPVYSDGDKTVTITLRKTYTWATDGHALSAQDLLFSIDVIRAAVKENPDNFGAYTPGDFPDNVVSAKATGPETVVLHLDKAYNPSWFTGTQLTEITPIPSKSWAKASPNGPLLDYSQPANAKKIWDFLSAASKQLSTYGTNPLWQDVDGPFRITSFNSTTDANTMVPNPKYGGPQKPVFSELKAEYFASSTAQFNALRAGELNQGIVPSEDLPQVPAIKDSGYNVYGYPLLGFTYVVFNFKDTTNNWDKVIGQLYVRQALAHLSDQAAIIHGVFHGAAAPAYGPVPAIPATAYVPDNASTDPYPYSISAATQLLTSHGWKVVPGGTTTCVRPGTGAGECGAGIPAGQNINFTLYYTNDPASSGQESVELASEAAKVGIKVSPVAKTFNYIIDQLDDPVAPQNNDKWQVEIYGGFSENPYPTTDTIFNTGGDNNEGDYSNPQANTLINASKYSADPNAVKNEAAFITKDLPGIFLPNQDMVFAWKGISGPPDSFANLTQYSFTPEDWYLTK